MIFLDSLLLGVVSALFTGLAILYISDRKVVNIGEVKQAVVLCGSFLFFGLVGLALRNVSFGTDTPAYLEYFRDYCRDSNQEGLELSFLLSQLFLNLVMFGSCQPDILISAWLMLMLMPLLFIREAFSFRLIYASLLIFSLVGLELTTNALRQGISIAQLILGLSLLRSRSLLAIPFLAFAIFLHSSTILVLAGLAMTTLHWRFIFAAVPLLGLLVFFSLQFSSPPSLINPFLYEIQKYMMHESSEIWIRILVFACVLSVLVAPWICCSRGLSPLLSLHYNRSLKLVFIFLPFLGLPFFGYRILYGIYPVVLYFTILSVRSMGGSMLRQSIFLLSANIGIMMIWAQGSSMIRQILFFDN
jgi:hypothetical protein